MLVDIGLLIGGLVTLLVGGEFLVRGATNLAYSIKISPMVVGLTIVAFGTSAPELLISLQSALSGADDLAMGNVIGSNICNLALVMGVTAIVYPIYVHNDTKIDWGVTIASSIFLYFFANQNNYIDSYEGVIFIVALIVYTYFLIDMSRKETIAKLKSGETLKEDIPEINGKKVFVEVAILAGGCLALYFGSDWFVTGASGIAGSFGVSEKVIGLTLVALGTSLPELVTSAIAAFKKNTDLALGNLLGSCIFNNLSILGITSMVKEIHVAPSLISTDMIWMLCIMLALLPMMVTRKKIGAVEGIILLVIYAVYVYFVLFPNA